jgi:hypothetical protein
MPKWLRYSLLMSLLGLLYYAGVQHWPFANAFTHWFETWLQAPAGAVREALQWLFGQKVPVLGQQLGHYVYGLGFAPLLAGSIALWRGLGWRHWAGWAAGLYLFFALGSMFLVLVAGRLLGRPLADAVPEFASAFFSPLPLLLVLVYFRLVRLLGGQ